MPSGDLLASSVIALPLKRKMVELKGALVCDRPALHKLLDARVVALDCGDRQLANSVPIAAQVIGRAPRDACLASGPQCRVLRCFLWQVSGLISMQGIGLVGSFACAGVTSYLSLPAARIRADLSTSLQDDAIAIGMRTHLAFPPGRFVSGCFFRLARKWLLWRWFWHPHPHHHQHHPQHHQQVAPNKLQPTQKQP